MKGKRISYDVLDMDNRQLGRTNSLVRRALYRLLNETTPDVDVAWERYDAARNLLDSYRLRAWDIAEADGGVALVTDKTTTDTWPACFGFDELMGAFRNADGQHIVSGLPVELLYEAARGRDGHLRAQKRKTG